MSVSQPPERIPELDALRGLAAIGVLCLHTMHAYFFWAWSCVDLFFILSGFLITGILLDNRQSPRMLMSFYGRRCLRIWPVYYLTLFICIAIYFCIGKFNTGTWPELPDGQWLNFVFLQYTEHYFPGIESFEYIWYFAHSWSLAVEEQFYIFWPLAILLLHPTTRFVIVLTVVALFLTALARYLGGYFYLLATRMDGLLFGILLAFMARGRTPWLYRIPLRYFFYTAICGLALLTPYLLSQGSVNLWSSSPRRAIEVTAFCILYASIVAVSIRLTGTDGLRLLRSRPLLYLGKVSFAIYMYQVPFAYLSYEAVARELIPESMAYPLVWIATLLAAHLSYHYFEKRILQLKRFLPYQETKRSPTSA